MSSECRIFGFSQCSEQPFRKAVSTINTACDDEALRLPSVMWPVCSVALVFCNFVIC